MLLKVLFDFAEMLLHGVEEVLHVLQVFVLLLALANELRAVRNPAVNELK